MIFNNWSGEDTIVHTENRHFCKTTQLDKGRIHLLSLIPNEKSYRFFKAWHLALAFKTPVTHITGKCMLLPSSAREVLTVRAWHSIRALLPDNWLFLQQ